MKKQNLFGLPKAKDVMFHQARIGDRQTTPAQKRKIKEEQKFICTECGKKFKDWQMNVHHKKGIAEHKNPLGDMPLYAQGHKPKLKYENRRNKVALCIPCHNKTKKRVKKKNNLYSLNISQFRF